MGLKKRNKVNAEFNMSSLTDIIFLLLIFFMLTSSMVHISVDLPEADARTIASSTVTVTIAEDGSYKLNGRVVPLNELQEKIYAKIAAEDKKEDATITIAAGRNLPWEKVTDIMRIANALKVKAIIATQPTRQ